MTKKRGQSIGNKLAYAALVVVFLVISVITYVYLSGTMKIGAASNPIITASKQSSQKAANPFVESSRAALDCTKKKEEFSKDACWQSYAQQNKDASYCDKIKDSNIFVSKDACINIIAQSIKSLQLCGSIQNQEIRKNCESGAKK